MYELLVTYDKGKTWVVVKRLEKSHYNFETLHQLGAHEYMDYEWKLVSVIYTDDNFRKI